MLGRPPFPLPNRPAAVALRQGAVPFMPAAAVPSSPATALPSHQLPLCHLLLLDLLDWCLWGFWSTWRCLFSNESVCECWCVCLCVCACKCVPECNRISLVPKRRSTSSSSSINKNTNKFMEFLVQNFYLHKRIKNTGTTSDVCAATTTTRTTTTAAQWSKSK